MEGEPWHHWPVCRLLSHCSRTKLLNHFFIQSDSPAAPGSWGPSGRTSARPLIQEGGWRSYWEDVSGWSQGEDGDLRFDQPWPISCTRMRKHIHPQTFQTREMEGELRVLGEQHLSSDWKFIVCLIKCFFFPQEITITTYICLMQTFEWMVCLKAAISQEITSNKLPLFMMK